MDIVGLEESVLDSVRRLGTVLSLSALAVLELVLDMAERQGRVEVASFA